MQIARLIPASLRFTDIAGICMERAIQIERIAFVVIAFMVIGLIGLIDLCIQLNAVHRVIVE